MKRIDRKPLGVVGGGLLALAFLGAPLAAGCGRVKADDTGSETHWLARCDSDSDCAQGSCECGVCTLPCADAPAECSELGIAGVRCTRDPSACSGSGSAQGGTAPAGSGACLLPCTAEADCAALGAQAFCAGERCELPAAGFSFDDTDDQVGENVATATLCDGSEDVRLTYVVKGGFLGLNDQFLIGAYGYGQTFFVIDGQCRFWEARSGDGWVYTGTLDTRRAQEFADSIGYGRLASYSEFEGEVCADAASTIIVAPEAQLECSCGCTTDPSAPSGWRTAFAAVSSDRRDAVFAGGETVTGPAQLVLMGLGNDNSDSLGSESWPLERPPVASEIVPESERPLITASSGALIEDAAELSAFRALRADFANRSQSYFGAIPMYSPSSGPASSFFRCELMFRDEVPEKVRAALVSAGR